MAQSVIGALRVNLGLDSAKFEKGAKRVQSPLKAMRAQFVAVAGAATLFGTAISAAAIKGAQEIDKAAKAARRLDASIAAFRALELAASEAGVPLSGLTNDIQNMNREIANIGVSGNADRALEKLGLSVSDLSGLDADAKVAKIADAVKGLGLSSGEATAVLRDLGVRNREMVLLLTQGGDALRQARTDVQQYGLALDAVDASRIETANDQIGRLAYIGQYAGQQLALALVPAMGALAQAMTDSLREGGVLRAVIDGLAGSVARISTYVATAATLFGVRYVGALVAARVATFSLAGALTALRGALIRTGFGALIVAAGELVFQFGRLVTAAGGFGNAMLLLGEVAAGVWQGIATSAGAVPPALNGVWQTIKADFLLAMESIVWGWRNLLQSLSTGAAKLSNIEIFGEKPFAGLAEGLADAASSASSASTQLLSAAGDARSAAAGATSSAGAIISTAFDGARAAAQNLQAAVGATKTETEGAADAADRLSEALAGEGAGGGGGGSGGSGGAGKSGGASQAAKEAAEQMSEVEDRAKQASDSIQSSFDGAFAGIIKGAMSLKEAMANILNSIADLLLGSVSKSLFSGLSAALGGAVSSGIPGFAKGTNFAPGGMALVGERGPELVNLPRGSQVIPNHKIGQSTGQAANITYAPEIDARGADEAAVRRLEYAMARDRAEFEGRIMKVLRSNGNRGAISKVVNR